MDSSSSVFSIETCLCSELMYLHYTILNGEIVKKITNILLTLQFVLSPVVQMNLFILPGRTPGNEAPVVLLSRFGTYKDSGTFLHSNC